MLKKCMYMIVGALMLLSSNDLSGNINACNDNVACKLILNLTAVNPTRAEIAAVDGIIKSQGMEAAALHISKNFPEFQTVVLKTFAESWCHQDGELGAPLNDTILTIIKMIMDEDDGQDPGLEFTGDFREVLWGDYIAIAEGQITGSSGDEVIINDGTQISLYNRRSNDHFLQLEARQLYHNPENITLVPQSKVAHTSDNGIISGIFSLSGFGQAAYTAGTNRRAIKMLLKEAFCIDLDNIRDQNNLEKYILRDVGVHDANGSVTTFKTVCKTCHGFIDQIAPAFIYYDIGSGMYPSVTYDRIIPVPDDNKMMKVVNPAGYIPESDEWRAEFTAAQMSLLGWPKDVSGGFGIKSLLQAMARSTAFTACQPKKAFAITCGRAPEESDAAFMQSLTKDFIDSGFKLKRSFLKSAVYCAEGK